VRAHEEIAANRVAIDRVPPMRVEVEQDPDLTPRERGIFVGTSIAWRYAVKGADPGPNVVHGRLPERLVRDIRAQGVDRYWRDADDPKAAETEFWRGFVYGVRFLLVEVKAQSGMSRMN
jgi:hypothetical protein